jgi:uroporphyrin-III C-methyltransferase/precorrin-2 dehydrogenase/sirohydrochlorin ferrochelatase
MPAICSPARAARHAAATPVALIDDGTTDRERRVVGTLATIERQAARARIERAYTLHFG